MAGGAGALTVQPVPAAHPYVQRACAAPGVLLLPDPPVPGAAPGVWWPPQALTEEWLRRLADRPALVHVHFGFEQIPVAGLRDWQLARVQAGVRLVVTVHDLVNPHHADHDVHREQLGVLLAGADAVLTLTAGAAVELRVRFGVAAIVVPHPHVVDLARIARPRAPQPVLVGLDLGTLRANVDAPGYLRALAGLPHQVRVSVRADALTARPDVEAALAEAAADPSFEVVVHARRTDDELWDHLQSLTIAVLPYAWGSHSGWLEACWDLGTAVVAPAVGHYAGQHADVVAADPADLAAAVRAVLGMPAPEQAERALARRLEAAAVRRRHAQVYARVQAA